MSFPNGLVITNAGRVLQSKAQIGAVLNFTKIAIGDGSLGGGLPQDRTALINQKKEVPITKLDILANGKALVGGSFNNSGLAVGYYFREIGVFATDPDVGEILYCYGNADVAAEYIPAEGASVIEKYVNVITIVGNAANVTATIEASLVFATAIELNTLSVEIATKETPAGAQTKATAAETTAKAYADALFAAIIDSSPATLNTLNELAAALGDDPNFATTVLTQIAAKADSSTLSNYVPKSLFTAANDFIIGSAAGEAVKKTVAEIRTLLACALTTGFVMTAGEANFADFLVTRAYLKDYAEVLGTTPATTGAVTFDLTTGNTFNLSPTGACTLAITNPPATGRVGSFTLMINMPASLYAMTYPASFKWDKGAIPTLVISKMAVITGFTIDAGATWHVGAFGTEF
jgi:hypothetical protein